jgi:predicted nucleic acid-binding protein
MPIELPDINVLLAMTDPAHVHHEAASQWFADASLRGWATCPLTENGFVRILSTPTYPGIRLRVADALALLETLLQNHAAPHHFWSDSISLRDRALFDPDAILRKGLRRVSAVSAG